MKRSHGQVLQASLASAWNGCVWRRSDRRAHTLSVDRRMLQIVFASLPAVLVMLWSRGLGGGAVGHLDALLAGLEPFALLHVVALVVCLFWEVIFARMLDRPADAGWLMSAWLYAAILPPTVTPLVAALGITVGVVFGCHIFGGTGRYLVSPALLGAAFVSVSYPSLYAASSWQAQTATPFALASFAGAAWLIARGVVSWRTIGGGAAAALLTAMLFSAASGESSVNPWYWHLVTGTFAFGLCFIATDPTTMPLTRPARWLHGLMCGALVVVIRSAVPAQPEGTLSALMFAGLCIALLDHAVIAASKRKMRRGAGL